MAQQIKISYTHKDMKISYVKGAIHFTLLWLFIILILALATEYALGSPNQPEDGLIGIRVFQYEGHPIIHIWNNNSKLYNEGNESIEQWIDNGADYYIDAIGWLQITNVNELWLRETICIRIEDIDVEKCSSELDVQKTGFSDNETFAYANGTMQVETQWGNVTGHLLYWLNQDEDFIRKKYYIDYPDTINKTLNITMHFKYDKIKIGGTDENDVIIINETFRVPLHNLDKEKYKFEQDEYQDEIFLYDTELNKYWRLFWDWDYPYLLKATPRGDYNSEIDYYIQIGQEKPITFERKWIDAFECDCTSYGCSLTPVWIDLIGNKNFAESYTNYTASVFAFSLDPSPCTIHTTLQYYNLPNGGWKDFSSLMPTTQSGWGCFWEDLGSCVYNFNKNTWTSFNIMGLNVTSNSTLRFYGNVHNLVSLNRTIAMNDSLPTISIVQPPNDYNQTSNTVEVECRAEDMQGIDNITLFTNITGTMTLNQTWHNQPNLTGQVFWLRFEDNNYTSEENIAPIQNEGLLSFQDGRKGQALNFSATEIAPVHFTTNLTYPLNNTNGLNLSEGSFSAWFKLQKEPTISLQRGMVALGTYNMSFIFGAPTSLYGNWFVMYYDQKKIYVETAEGILQKHSFNFNMDDGGWHHISLVWKDSGVSKNADLYADGIQLGRNMVLENKLNASSNISIGSFRISSQYSTTHYQWSGRIDEVQIYNRTLTFIDVYNLFLNQSARHNFTIENVPYGTYNFTCRANDNFFGIINDWSNETEADSRKFNILELIIFIAAPPNNYWMIAIAIILLGTVLILGSIFTYHFKHKEDKK